MRTPARILAPLALLLTMLLPAGVAAAEPAETDSVSFFNFEVNCNAEEVVLFVTNRYVLKQQPDGTFFMYNNIHGKGIGSQGNEYVLNESLKGRYTGEESSFRAQLVSKGSAPNLYVTLVSGKNGGLAVVDCRG